MKPTITTKALGYLLEAIGYVFKYQPVYNLGHYLTCKGTKVRLFDRYNQTIHASYAHCCYNAKASGWYTFYDEGNDSIKSKITGLHNAIGKVRWRMHSLGYSILDYYVFYPTCWQDHWHGRNCDCTNKLWNGLAFDIPTSDLVSKLIRSLVKIRHSRTIAGPLGTALVIQVRPKELGISIGQFDKVLEPLGKPFYTVAHYQTQEEEPACLS